MLTPVSAPRAEKRAEHQRGHERDRHQHEAVRTKIAIVRRARRAMPTHSAVAERNNTDCCENRLMSMSITMRPTHRAAETVEALGEHHAALRLHHDENGGHGVRGCCMSRRMAIHSASTALNTKIYARPSVCAQSLNACPNDVCSMAAVDIYFSAFLANDPRCARRARASSTKARSTDHRCRRPAPPSASRTTRALERARMLRHPEHAEAASARRVRSDNR